MDRDGTYERQLSKLRKDLGEAFLAALADPDRKSTRLIYGAELLRTKLLSGDLDLRIITKGRVHRGRPKKT